MKRSMTAINKDWFDYIILLVGAGLAVVSLTVFNPSSYVKFVVSLLVGVFYACWGIWHHSRSHDLTWAIVLEYLAFGTFISVLLIVSLEE